jgi:DNA-binding GntR family transcriptional regulator
MPLPESLGKIKKSPPLEEKVYQKLKQDILFGTLPANAFYTETEVAEQLGVSRTPIRKALARLEQENFISSIPAKGFRVVEISAQDVRDVYELREILDCYVLRAIINRLTEEDLGEMKTNLRQADQCMEKKDYPGFLKHNRAFHHVLDRRHGNKKISSVLDDMDGQVSRFISNQLRSGYIDATLPFSYRDHRDIFKAIQDGDIEGAVDTVRRHLRRHADLLTSEKTPVQ